MKGRVFDVVAYITRTYGVDGGTAEDRRDLRDDLLDAGFEEDDVERALAWLRRLRGGPVPGGQWTEAPATALRVATVEELQKVSAAARGFLLRLERAGILSAAMREAVLERALSLEVPEVGLEEARVLVALVLKASPAADDQLVTCVLEGDLRALYQ